MKSRTKSVSFNAQKLRLVLITIIVLLVVGSGVGFYVAQSALRTYAVETANTNQEAANAKNSVNSLQNINQKLDNLSGVESKAQNVFVSQGEFERTIYAGFTDLARSNGFDVTSVSFTGSGATDGGSAPTAPAPTPVGEGAATPTDSATGLTSRSASVTLEGSVEFQELMDFLRAIENYEKILLIDGVDIQNGENNKVSISNLTVKAFIQS